MKYLYTFFRFLANLICPPMLYNEGPPPRVERVEDIEPTLSVPLEESFVLLPATYSIGSEAKMEEAPIAEPVLEMPAVEGKPKKRAVRKKSGKKVAKKATKKKRPSMRR